MDTESIAHQLTTALCDEFPEYIFAIGWYDGVDGGQTGVTFISEDFEELGERASNVLGEALLESIGRSAYERLHGEKLRCTTRVYESLIDVDLPLTEHSGIVIAVNPVVDGRFMDMIEFVHSSTVAEFGLEHD